MPHKFNADKMNKLENKQRKIDLPSKDTLKKMLINIDYKLIDVGAGIGYFSIPASKIVGKGGKVYAVDTSKKMIEELNKRIKEQNINNIEIIKGKEYDAQIPNKENDYVLMVNMLHEVEDKILLLENYLKKVKKDGMIGIIEFKKIDIPKGPPLSIKLSSNDIKKYFKKLNIDTIKEIDLNEYQYGIVGKKINKGPIYCK